jgi:hypothetical protein
MPRLVPLIATTALLLAGAGQAAAQSGSSYGAYEPNNSASEAYGPLSGGTTYNAAIENAQDQDWYVFYVSGEQQMDVSLSNTGSDTYCFIEGQIQDEAGNQPVGGDSAGQNETVHLRWTSPPGTTKYYLVITHGSSCSYGTADTYSFQVNPASALTTQPAAPPPPIPGPASPSRSAEPTVHPARATTIPLPPSGTMILLAHVSCPHACTVDVLGNDRVGGHRVAVWRTSSSEGPHSFWVSVRLSATARRHLRRGLRRHQRVGLSATVTVTDTQTGQVATTHVSRLLR